MRNPCFDTKTKTDCPDRKIGCNKDCEKWDKWCKERNKNYTRRRMEFLTDTDEIKSRCRRY